MIDSRPSPPSRPWRPGWGLAGLAIAAAAVTAAPGLDWHRLAPAPQSRVAPYTLLIEPDNGLDGRIALFRDRAARDPEGFSDLNELAGLYIAKARATGDYGYYVLAERAASRSLAAMPTQNPAGSLALAQIALARHDFQGALALGREAARWRQKAARPLFVTAYLALGEVDQAWAIARTMPDEAPGLESSLLRAQVEEARGRDDAARADLERALAHEQVGQLDGSALARTWLARLALRHGDDERARDLVGEALRLRPHAGPALALGAALDARAGRFQAGADRLHQAYEAGQGAAYLAQAATLEGHAGAAEAAVADRARAEGELRRDLAQSGFGHRRDLARLLLDRGGEAANTEALALMRAEVGVRHDAETLKTFTRALVAAGRWAEAQAVAARAMATGYHDAELWGLAAAAERGLGHAAEAEALDARAADLDPHYQDKAAGAAAGGQT